MGETLQKNNIFEWPSHLEVLQANICIFIIEVGIYEAWSCALKCPIFKSTFLNHK